MSGRHRAGDAGQHTANVDRALASRRAAEAAERDRQSRTQRVESSRGDR